MRNWRLPKLALPVVFLLTTVMNILPVRAQEYEGGQGTATGTLYDPEGDIISPGGARWLYIGTMLYSSYFWALGVSEGFGLQGKWSTVTQLVGTPAAFFPAVILTRDHTTTLGMVSLSSAGSWQGAGVGLATGDLLTAWGENALGDLYEPRYGFAVAGSIAGNILGYRYAESQQLNWGNAEMLAHAALWGGAYGGLLTSLFVPYNHLMGDDSLPWERKVIELGILGGWTAGGYYWNKLAPRNYTTGDALSMYNGSALSFLSGFAAYELMPDAMRAGGNDAGRKVALMTEAVVNAGGLVGTYYFHQNRDVGFGQSILVSLGTVLGGAMVGSAAAVLFTPDNGSPTTQLTLTTMALGGWGGFLLTHYLLGTQGESQSGSHEQKPSFRVALAPENAAFAWLCAHEKVAARLPLVSVEF